MSEEIFEAPAVEEFKALMRDPAARQAFVRLRADGRRGGVRTSYQLILKLVSTTPWVIREEVLGVIVDLLVLRAEGGRYDAEEISERIEARSRREKPTGPPGVAVVPLHGVLIPKAQMLDDISGGSSIQSFRQSFREALADEDVRSIVLDVDSPGGMVDGVPEMASEIRAARGTKPILAVANTEAASGAYWLASQADQVIATKSGRVGSIGVFTPHEDISARQEQDGVRTTLVSAGKVKTEGNPFEKLSDEGRAHLQSMVNDYYNMFVTDVANGRKVPVDQVRSGYGEGRGFTARQALEVGMVDRVGTLEAVVSELANTQAKEMAMVRRQALSRGGVIAPLTRITTLSNPNTDNATMPVFQAAPEPVTVEAMRSHLTADPPEGHGMPQDEAADMPMAEMRQMHRQKHEDGADHDHEDMEEMMGEDFFQKNLAAVQEEVAKAQTEPDAMFQTEAEFEAAVDNSPWDGGRAMGEASSADNPASAFRSICAGERDVGGRSERQHWALPHHYLARVPSPNAGGVRNALQRLPQTQGLTNRDAAQRHLDAHMREINPESEAFDDIGQEIAELRLPPVARDPLAK